MFDILTFQSTSYFVFGQERKTSLIAEFCRENNYEHVKNSTSEQFNNKPQNNTIIQGSTKLFFQVESLRPQLQAIFIGNVFSEQQLQIRRDYRKIGKCIQVREFNYDKFRKAMFPNLIFFYGPREDQNINCANAIANQIGYCRVALPPNANIFIKEFKKSINYTVSGFFTQISELKVLQQYFNIKVVHLQYNRIDLPQKSAYFDKQFELLTYLKSKTYYFAVNGLDDDIKVIDHVSQVLSPVLVYCQVDETQKRQYLNEYVYRNQQTTVILSIHEIQSIYKRKNIRLAENSFQKTNLLNQILYKDFSIKTALILDYPGQLDQILNFQSANRKFSTFLDLLSSQNQQYFDQFTTSMYFLQNQFRIVPNTQKSLECYLNTTINYWLINGPSGSGKTSVAKHLSSQFGLKLIEYETYFASIKEKLIGPEDGEQVPFKKILAHFKNLLTQSINDTYIIDGLPFDNKQLEQWIRAIGTPSVINLQVQQNQSIKRTRKKNQADVNAEINEEQLTKAKQSISKAQSWIQKVRNLCPVIQIHQVDFNSQWILSQKLINKIFRKNIYLVQKHNSLAYQNVALKENLALINLHMNPLRQILPIVRKMQNKDLILCYYHQDQEKLISEDLYWIEKNIGNIRYLAIWSPQETEVYEQKLDLVRPQVQEKQKVQGIEGEQKPPAEQEPGQKKDIFDIYAYQWSKAVNPKNLSQWFIKSRKNVTKVQSEGGKDIFENWKKIIQSLQASDDSAVYHTFK